MSRLSSARSAALSCLMAAVESGRYVREVLDASQDVAALDPRDAGLARRLALGVTATSGCLDELLDRCLARPRRVSPRVRMALRVSTFELLYLGTPARAAVSQGVELVRGVAAGAAGLANAVLRRVAAEAPAYLAAEDIRPETGDTGLYRAARGAGLPVWLVAELVEALDGRPAGHDAAAALLASELEPAPAAIHVNAFRPVALEASAASGEATSAATSDAGSPIALPGCIAPADVRALAAAGAFDRADVVASDANAQLVATAATCPGSCLEVGAGRGTKTFIMACQARRAGFDRASVAVDLSGGKLAASAERMSRAGIGGARYAAGDARGLDAVLAAVDAEQGRRARFDSVLVDAPCSGTGTMRRHPEIPWRLAPEDVREALPALQLELLQQAAFRVAPGGELFYATCSVLAHENEAVVKAFLATEAGSRFAVAPVSQAQILACPGFARAGGLIASQQTEGGFFQTVPEPGGFDGHFCARFIRI